MNQTKRIETKHKHKFFRIALWRKKENNEKNCTPVVSANRTVAILLNLCGATERYKWNSSTSNDDDDDFVNAYSLLSMRFHIFARCVLECFAFCMCACVCVWKIAYVNRRNNRILSTHRNEFSRQVAPPATPLSLNQYLNVHSSFLLLEIIYVHLEISGMFFFFQNEKTQSKWLNKLSFKCKLGHDGNAISNNFVQV